MRIIPAIDIIDGKCVRLTQGDYAQKKIYNENPLDVAKAFEDAGLQYLHLVDLDGAKAGKVINWKVVESITKNTILAVDFGGGIKTAQEISALFDAGITQVNLGSIAVKHSAMVFEWINQFGSEKIILSADVRNDFISINGWQENSSIHIKQFIEEYVSHGIQYVTCTDIGRDGMLRGPNIDLYGRLQSTFPEIKFVASGGVSSVEDLLQLRQLNIDGVVLGKAIYENKISLTELINLHR